MPSSLRRRLRLARRGLWYITAVSVVLLALVAGIVSQLLPMAERHPERIAEWLSARAGRPVTFDRVQTEWTRRGPLLRLDGLRVGEGKDGVSIGTAEILVSQYAGILPGRSFTELRVRNLDLILERTDDGRWRVRGLPGQTEEIDPLSALEGLGELQVIDARLGIIAPSLGIETQIPEADVRLQVNGSRVRGGLRAWAKRGRAPIDAVLDFDRKTGDGRLYAALRDTDLSAWSSLLRVQGVTVTGGFGHAEIWTTVRRRQVAAITVDGDLRKLQFRGAAFPTGAAAGGGRVPTATYARLRTHAHWKTGVDGWRLDTPSLQVKTDPDSRPQVLDGLVLAGGRQFGLRAERIDAGPLFALVALSDRLDPKLRLWLASAKPGAVLEAVRVGGRRGGALRIEARVRDLQLDSVGNTPGVVGLAGHLLGDSDGYRFTFDSQQTLRFLWPTGFGLPHDVRLGGDAVVWRDETAGWRLATSALRVDGVGYGADVRGGLWFQADGTRPLIDIAADIDDTDVPVAKRFWPHFAMAPSVVQWLDTGLIGGKVLGGRAVVVGDLDHWPFQSRDGQPAKGVFDARATLRGAVIKFQADWPQATHMDADVAFIGNGFTVNGKAALAEVGIREFTAGIADYHKSELLIDAKADADASKFLTLLRQSPLQKAHGATMAKLAASGAVSTNFSLFVPLSGGGQKSRMAGEIELRGVRLSESEWKLAFSGVTGKAHYDQDGFDAEGLRAQYDRQDGRLTLRAGPGHVRDSRQGFEAELEASMTTDDLLDRSSELAWLKPHLHGRSRWVASIAIPAAVAASKGGASVSGVTRLQLRSDMVGTALALPAPLDKSVATALPTVIDLQLPISKGDIAIALGQRIALRVRQTQGQTGIRAQLGSDHVNEAPPVSGLVLAGRTPTLDALGWVAILHGGSGGKMPLRRVDATVDRLQLLGATFPDVRLQVVPATGGLGVQLEGPSLAGALMVPDGDTGAVAGRLQRLYWRAAGDTGNGGNGGNGVTTANTAATSAGSNDIDPAKVPAINLHVDDLRIAGASLGQAQFQSRPSAIGMDIVQFQSRAPKRKLDLTGDWSGRGTAARTKLALTVVSEDFGDLIGDLGFGNHIGGGKGDIRFEAAWPGSPMAFQLPALEGTLRVAVKDGQLVEIEPGGTGRVLGLLSLAQLPRRLTLDFRDFFSKGFTFNKLAGTVNFGGGNARSDDLTIDGPAATINIRGTANLRAQTFDQTIEVLPKAGNLLTAVGAIAAGPVGAAVGAVANAVLRKPLGQAAAKNYRVTGPWKDPKVEVVERMSSRPTSKSG